MDEAAPILRAPRHSPDLPAPRRPRMARLTSRGTLCGPLPARGLPNTDDMATLQMATPVSGPMGCKLRALSHPRARPSVSACWRRGVDGAWPSRSKHLLTAAEHPASGIALPASQRLPFFASDHSQLSLSTLLLHFALGLK